MPIKFRPGPFLALLLLANPAGPAFAENKIKLISAVSVYKELISKIAPGLAAKQGVQIELTHDPELVIGSPDIMKAVLDGRADAGAAGISFDEWLRLAKEKMPAENFSSLTHRVIGKDLMNVVTHKDLNIQALSDEQLLHLFTGKIMNWKEIGGPDLPVLIFLQEKSVSRTEVFRKKIMGGKNFPSTARWAKTAEELTQKIATTPGGVGFVPQNQIDAARVFPVKTNEIGRPITLVTKGKPSEDVLRMVKYIHDNPKH